MIPEHIDVTLRKLSIQELCGSGNEFSRVVPNTRDLFRLRRDFETRARMGQMHQYARGLWQQNKDTLVEKNEVYLAFKDLWFNFCGLGKLFVDYFSKRSLHLQQSKS